MIPLFCLSNCLLVADEFSCNRLISTSGFCPAMSDCCSMLYSYVIWLLPAGAEYGGGGERTVKSLFSLSLDSGGKLFPLLIGISGKVILIKIV